MDPCTNSSHKHTYTSLSHTNILEWVAISYSRNIYNHPFKRDPISHASLYFLPKKYHLKKIFFFLSEYSCFTISC